MREGRKKRTRSWLPGVLIGVTLLLVLGWLIAREATKNPFVAKVAATGSFLLFLAIIIGMTLIMGAGRRRYYR